MTAVVPELTSEAKTLSCARHSVSQDKQGIPWWLGLSYKGIGQYDLQDKLKPRKVSVSSRPRTSDEPGPHSRVALWPMGISQASRAARALPWNQAWKLYKPFNESDTSLKPAFLVPLFSSYELVVKRPCERCVNYAVQSQTPSVCRVSKLCKRPAAVIFFFKGEGVSWWCQREKPKKKGEGLDRGVPKCVFREYLRRQVGSWQEKEEKYVFVLTAKPGRI